MFATNWIANVRSSRKLPNLNVPSRTKNSSPPMCVCSGNFEFGLYSTMVVARAFSSPIRSNMKRFTPYDGDGMYFDALKLLPANRPKSALIFMLLGRSNDVHGKCEHRKCNSLPEVVVLPKITIVVLRRASIVILTRRGYLFWRRQWSSHYR